MNLINEKASKGLYHRRVEWVGQDHVCDGVSSQACRAVGYFISMFYLWIPNSALALQRIKGRVLEGGHDVPDAIVRRRFKKTLWNLFHVYDQLLDQLMIFDNSSEEPRALFEKTKHQNQIFDQELYNRVLNEAKVL